MSSNFRKNQLKKADKKIEKTNANNPKKSFTTYDGSKNKHPIPIASRKGANDKVKANTSGIPLSQ
ncbi:TPA: hypothetical protein I8Y00_000572 [Citrobacter farmeri]|uniref:Uncharacterized protein n=1 Tax=Citrobacter farmeri TaxID=67824 RepID=A0A8H9TU24_9ENTR|nr:hypothetical protein [Citrobacter farmeri]HAT2168285.1 hypothetical protein [Citrobacter freundii]EKU0079037.1 hypothetical protein [Citrobacter farmeri]EKU0082702.1 hypothetical protein [Citrobacter farmeri]EMB4689419.1 hypothetical protein [Citrobacter farmeri]MCP1693580.1 hypothetical protein [Citrobacter farmeri]